jgi:hypothetical protein
LFSIICLKYSIRIVWILEAEEANNSENHRSLFSALTFWAEMGSASGQQDAADGGFAAQAGQPGAHVDAVLELEKTSHSLGIHVVGDGRTTQPDGVL